MIQTARTEVEKLGHEVIYGDTDSIMINLGTKIKIDVALDKGKELAAYITTFFKDPCKIEFEKVYYPYLLCDRKKRYAGRLWTDSSTYDKIDVKGLQSVRHDTIPLISDCIKFTLKSVLNLPLEEAKVQISSHLIKVWDDLNLYGIIDLGKLKKSQRLTKPIEEYGKVSHVCAIRRAIGRGSKKALPQVEDKVSFIVGEGPPKSSVTDKVEFPSYILKHDIPIDKKYYSDSLKKTLADLLKYFMSKSEISLIFATRQPKNIEEIEDLEELGAFVKNCHDTCKNCQGDAFQIPCNNESCEIFFTRVQTHRRLKKRGEKDAETAKRVEEITEGIEFLMSEFD
jgi:DNA polymerase delta subunit 1